MKKCCLTQPRQGTFSRMLSFSLGRMWMEASTVTCVSEGNSCRLLTRNILIMDTFCWTDPTVSTLRAWHCSFSGGGRPGHLETGWYPYKSLPVSPNNFWGVLKQDIYREGWVRVRQFFLPLPASAHISSLHDNGIKELRSLALIGFSDHPFVRYGVQNLYQIRGCWAVARLKLNFVRNDVQKREGVTHPSQRCKSGISL